MSCDVCGETLGANPRCPEHGTSEHAPGDDDDPSTADDATAGEIHAHYDDAATDLDAVAMQEREHICGHCTLAPLCRYAPEENNLLIAVARCRAFMPRE